MSPLSSLYIVIVARLRKRQYFKSDLIARPRLCRIICILHVIRIDKIDRFKMELISIFEFKIIYLYAIGKVA